MSSSTDVFQDPNQNFKIDNEFANENRPPPKCMLDLAPPNPDRQPLTDVQLGEAKMKLWNAKFTDLKFPRERKFRRDPQIPGQAVGVISFIPSANAIPDKDGCFGTVKLRGNFPNPVDAERYAAMLMRKYDSFAEYDLVCVGQEFPLMIDNSVYTAETREINLKAIVDDISLSYIRKKKEEERREKDEVQERAQRLISKDTTQDKEESIDDLEYYTTLRTKKAHCQHVIDEAKKKQEEAQEALERVIKEISELDDKHPNYRKEYLHNYEKALHSIGTDITKNPLIGYMKKDIEEEQKQQ
jgi:hypothetical protein